ncbi:type IX secretion system sortase PorU [Parasegetibacter sp. NRK P23]|uniref:type IX secretion system sortase PorU n=1 Tax=Parasegetibacter sp. NRK P23 TaxID=2942999 RepID=UPI0020438088|nr:type IX secretion system sortase PorU [Parasegetibacter sp. NRK P23]MCM5527692.1 type IX secretion system sortase PorU [Parasegetibacter sp. NRK P23]
MRFLVLVFLLANTILTSAQRVYAPHSVLQQGAWFRIGVDTAGVYRIDLALLNTLGYTGNSFPAEAIRVFGRTGAMLPEAMNTTYTDDLQEIPCRSYPGFVLFYAPGAHIVEKDSVNQSFTHRTNLFSNRTYYYIKVEGSGLSIPLQQDPGSFQRTVSAYDDVRFYENELVNFLGSGKEWFGEEFANAPGKTLTRNFSFTFPGRDVQEPVRFNAAMVGRSVNGSNRFSVQLNGGAASSTDIAATGSGAYDIFARKANISLTQIITATDIQAAFNFQPGGFNAQGWLDHILVHARTPLRFNGVGQWHFRDWRSVAPGNARFEISSAPADAEVWEVTAPLSPVRMATQIAGNTLGFVQNASRLRTYIAFSPAAALRPAPLGTVKNQDLHGAPNARFLVIAAPELVAEAQRLAAYHEAANGLTTLIVTPEMVFNEFSAGIPDPTAIRDFVKMQYDRAGGDTSRQPRYLLLFGDASFDYKNRLGNNTNFVPAYQSNESLDPLSTYTSDDFFGLLDNTDNINNTGTLSLLDIGIGRIPAGNPAEAKAYVDKVLAYHTPQALGPWRNELSFLADDEDDNLHLQDAEYVSEGLETLNPSFNTNKYYLDAFPQQSTSAGSRYPAATQASNNKVFNGTLIWNYSGHGGFTRLAEEVLLDKETAAQWRNKDRYPLLITATCDFAPYDNPGMPSLGEQVLLQPYAGAIALMTTTRVVFAFSNRTMNYNYLQEAFKRKANGFYPSLGEAVKNAKNFTYQFSGDIVNNRKFTLLGDPALTLAFPRYKIRTTHINGKETGALKDTIRALDKVIVTGEITDMNGVVLTDFNGAVFPSVFDKKSTRRTLGNDQGSPVTGFETREQVLFKGKSSVKDGRFSFEFIVPKDISYAFGEGWINYYAENGQYDANDHYANLVVGGGSNTGSNDQEGPNVKAWMNDEKFVNGSITNNAPILLVKLTDSSGINTTGTGIGHNITAILDNDLNNPIVLNEFYQSEQDSYKKGTIRYQLPPLEPGEHTLEVKAWDVANNSGAYLLRFKVTEQGDLVVDHVLNYPNPFTTKTSFWFEHNRPFENLQVHIRVFSLTGKLVKSLKNTIITTGNRSSDVEWDGKDDFGAKLARGVYWYILRISAPDGQTKEVIQKLVIL